jgi:hypothetical protein
MPVALIARANLEFARQYLSDSWRVFCRIVSGSGPSWAGQAVSATAQGNNFPEHVQNDDGASHKAGLPFVRERHMALGAVLAAGEAAAVVAA